MTTTLLRQRAGLLQICLAGVLWGTGGLAVQVIREHAPLSPTTISAYRTTIAALVLLAACVAMRQLGGVLRLLCERPGPTVFVGMATAAYQALYFASVVWVGVTVSTVVSLGVAPLALAVRDAVSLAVWGVVGIVLVMAAIAGAAREKHPSGAGPIADPDPGRPTVGGFIRDGRGRPPHHKSRTGSSAPLSTSEGQEDVTWADSTGASPS